MKKVLIVSITLLFTVNFAFALPTIGAKQKPAGLNKTAAGCNQTTAVIDLDINNVRSRLMNGGDMWWDRSTGTAQYEVPKGNNTNALFAGSIWIGGIDQQTGDLRVAAQTYRQSGNDYWSGPLDLFNGATIDFQTCADWDRFWKINSSDISKFKLLAEACSNNPACINAQSASIPDVIKEWPGRNANDPNKGSGTALGSTGQPLNVPDREMAPFIDVDNDNVYNWRKGDYPLILGDQYIWWVFNDKGDAKTETESDAIGIEVHTGAFAFSTNDCLNEATFYNYKVINYSTSILDSAYMATWTDADLGYAADDFIGCDTTRGLGILYNADSYDETSTGYGYDIPMVGVDFFRGPRFTDANNQIVELQMSVFTYFTNGGGRVGDPRTRDDFYGYMTGTWVDNSPFVLGCNPAATSGIPYSSVFPNDPCKGGVNEASCNNTAGDRRFVHSAGPFQLVPGIIPSDVTIGAVWVPNAGSGNSACFSKIQVCDDKAQELFDTEFKLPFGPQAPNVNVQALDRKLVFQLYNDSNSNNYKERYGTDRSNPKYSEISAKAVKGNFPDSLYKFEGYIVYQLKDATVTLSDIRSKDGSTNTEKARIAYQCDLENGVTDILNYEIDPEISSTYYVPKLMAQGADKGLKHSFQITQDLFATGTVKDLINYKTYYFMAVAYGYNKFDNNDPDTDGNEFDPNDFANTQNIQYIQSRTDGNELPIKIIKVIPHPGNDSLYIQTYADYGTGIQLKRMEGIGNGGQDLILTPQTESEILYGGNNHSFNPVYAGNHGPLEIFVTDPDSVKAGNYELYITPTARYSGLANQTLGAIADSTTWYIKNLTTGETVMSEKNITAYNDQLLIKWGLSVSVVQTLRPGDEDSIGKNAYITSEILFDDPNKFWLTGIRDQEEDNLNNWIWAGTAFTPTGTAPCTYTDWTGDRKENYEDMVSGTWAPYALVADNRDVACGYGLMYNRNDRTRDARMQNLFSVDVVLTSDKNLWTRCPVIEMSDNKGALGFGEGDQYKFNIRRHAAWDKGVDANGNPTYVSGDNGWSWFPGYAINLETGERLNIMFGEESINAVDNGNDMLFNPTSRAFDAVNGQLKWGGKHIIYVTNTKYDQGNYNINKMRAADGVTNSALSTNTDLQDVFKTVMWVGNVLGTSFSPMLSPKDGLVPTTTRVRLRVERPYDQYTPPNTTTLKNNGWPLYSFSTADLAPAKIGDGRNDYSNNHDALLKRILPVPNPYYAYSEYETDRLDTKVRIINLPEKATIKIYTIDGTLVRTLVKNDAQTSYIDWDVKNNQGIPIASGMYLMHVNIPDIGETVLKWFGAMRPVDLTSF